MASSAELSTSLGPHAPDQDSGPIAIWLSPSGQIEAWSTQAQKLSGWQSAEVCGLPLAQLLVTEPDSSPDWLAQQLRLASERGQVEYTSQRLAKDGSHYWVRCRLEPVHDGSGSLRGYSEVSCGLHQSQLPSDMPLPATGTLSARDFAQMQKLESLGVLAGGIAHDFNNMLTTIMGNASLVLRELPFEHPMHPRVQDLVDAARRAAQLTRQLLAYSGKTQPEIRALDLSRQVREISHLLSSCVSKKVQLVLQLDSDLPAVEADLAQVQQLVMNLVLNGSEAIGDRCGNVLVRTGVRHLSETDRNELLQAPEQLQGDYLFVQVRDSGIGMDEAVQSKLFEPFFTTKSQGRGLGLSAVLGIVRAHHGALQVQSAPGQGSCFTVYFPTSQRTVQVTCKTTSVSFRKSGTVLIIEDEPTIRAVAKLILEELGFEVLEAPDGRQGLAVYQAHRSKILAVLLDMALPELGGDEVFFALRKLAPQLPIVLSSGYSEEDTLRRLGDGSQAVFLRKPYTASEFAKRFMEVLG